LVRHWASFLASSFKEPEGEKRGKVVQLLEKRKISGEESIELVGAVGDRNGKH